MPNQSSAADCPRLSESTSSAAQQRHRGEQRDHLHQARLRQHEQQQQDRPGERRGHDHAGRAQSAIEAPSADPQRPADQRHRGPREPDQVAESATAATRVPLPAPNGEEVRQRLGLRPRPRTAPASARAGRAATPRTAARRWRRRARAWPHSCDGATSRRSRGAAAPGPASTAVPASRRPGTRRRDRQAEHHAAGPRPAQRERDPVEPPRSRRRRGRARRRDDARGRTGPRCRPRRAPGTQRIARPLSSRPASAGEHQQQRQQQPDGHPAGIGRGQGRVQQRQARGGKPGHQRRLAERELCATCGTSQSCRCTISHATRERDRVLGLPRLAAERPSPTHATHSRTSPACFIARQGAEGETVAGSTSSGTAERAGRMDRNFTPRTKKAAEAAFPVKARLSRQADARAPLVP